MYDYLAGTIASKKLTELVLDVGGVGYSLEIPISTADALPSSGAVKVWVHLHVREDTLKLFGFATTDERRLFRLLQKVTGIGPGVAATILSRASVADICAAIANERVDILKSLKGVGPKTAQRLVTELADAIGEVQSGEISPAGEKVPRSALESDAVQALEVLGCSRKAAQDAVRRVLREQPDAQLEDIVKKAVRMAWPTN